MRPARPTARSGTPRSIRAQAGEKDLPAAPRRHREPATAGPGRPRRRTPARPGASAPAPAGSAPAALRAEPRTPRTRGRLGPGARKPSEIRHCRPAGHRDRRRRPEPFSSRGRGTGSPPPPPRPSAATRAIATRRAGSHPVPPGGPPPGGVTREHPSLSRVRARAGRSRTSGGRMTLATRPAAAGSLTTTSALATAGCGSRRPPPSPTRPGTAPVVARPDRRGGTATLRTPRPHPPEVVQQNIDGRHECG